MVRWDLTGIHEAASLCWEYHTVLPGESDPPEEYGWKSAPQPGCFIRMSPNTLALIKTGEEAHLDHICSDCVDEWMYRLDSLFDIDHAHLFTQASDGEGVVPVRIDRSIVEDHIGLKIEIVPWTSSIFCEFIRKLHFRRQQERAQ
jgi:hypothetical protein